MATKDSKPKETKKVPVPEELSEDVKKNFFPSDEEEKRFLKWFWEGTNGNELIRKLNIYVQNEQGPNKFKDRIRREVERPVIYAVVLNDDSKLETLKAVTLKDESLQWKLCKVGFTHRSVEKETGNRMEQVESKINSTFDDRKVAKTLFIFPIGAVDTTPFRDTEKRIREKVGTPVPKEKAKEMGLPVHTEWVLTTQTHIDYIKDLNKKKKESGGDLIDCFKGIQKPPEVQWGLKETLEKKGKKK